RVEVDVAVRVARDELVPSRVGAGLDLADRRLGQRPLAYPAGYAHRAPGPAYRRALGGIRRPRGPRDDVPSPGVARTAGGLLPVRLPCIVRGGRRRARGGRAAVGAD